MAFNPNQDGVGSGQGAAQDWFAQNAPPGVSTSPGQPMATAAPAAGGYSFQVPAGFDPSNPVDKLVLDQFQQGISLGLSDPGSQPTPQNLQYWKTQITNTGGATPDNLAYWNSRMTSGRGGGGGGTAGGQNPGMPGFQSAPGWGSGTTAPNPYAPPTFTTPAPYQAPTFTAPTGVTEQNDPGFQFRIDEAQKAIQSAAAAKGSIDSGGTQQALQRDVQDYASGEFGNVYNRALNTFQTNAGLGLQGYQTNLGANQWQQGQQANYGLTGYQTNAATQRNAQSDFWARLNNLYQGGLTASGSAYQVPPA